MELRRLAIADLESFFRCRLSALEKAPTAFLRDAEEERAGGSGFFAPTLSHAANDRAIFGALEHEQVIASIGIFRQAGARLAHKASIWGMYVATEHQGKGLGAKLLDLAI